MNDLDPLPLGLRLPVSRIIRNTRRRRGLAGQRQFHIIVVDGIPPAGIPLGVGDGERMAGFFLARVAAAGVVSVGWEGVARRRALGGDVFVGPAELAAEEGVYHRYVADYHGHKGLTTCPGAGFCGAVGSAL